jgi:hypothetical protein
MAFTGHEDCTVTLANASTMNESFRSNYPTQPKGIYFSMDTLNSILAQTDCVGIRFYFALASTGQMRLTFAGVKANEDDILAIIGDGGLLCPPHCGVNNALNTSSR